MRFSLSSTLVLSIVASILVCFSYDQCYSKPTRMTKSKREQSAFLQTSSEISIAKSPSICGMSLTGISSSSLKLTIPVPPEDRARAIFACLRFFGDPLLALKTVSNSSSLTRSPHCDGRNFIVTVDYLQIAA